MFNLLVVHAIPNGHHFCAIYYGHDIVTSEVTALLLM